MDIILAGFRMQGTTFFEYCVTNNFDRRNVTRAVLGTWKGKKAMFLREKIIEDSNANALQQLQNKKQD